MLLSYVENSGRSLSVACADGHTLRWSWLLLMLFAQLYVNPSVSILNRAQKVHKLFFLFVCSFWILAQSVFSTTSDLPSRNPVRWNIFIQTRESPWHPSTGWRSKIILSAVYRVSSPSGLQCKCEKLIEKENGVQLTTGTWNKSVLLFL